MATLSDPPAPAPIKPDSAIPALAGRGFTEPNYTQIPNEIIAALPWLSNADLRVLLVLVRYSLGYHRTTCQASYSDIARAAGLTRPTVITTCARLHAAGMIAHTRRFPCSQWRLNISSDTNIHISPATPHKKTGRVVQVV